jgi:dihydrodipicolinate synthase/N-acetylneuraminate lyase
VKLSKLVLEGIFVPHITPFMRSGELDVDALKKCVSFWLDAGVSGLSLVGATGKPHTFQGKKERESLKQSSMRSTVRFLLWQASVA